MHSFKSIEQHCRTPCRDPGIWFFNFIQFNYSCMPQLIPALQRKGGACILCNIHH